MDPKDSVHLPRTDFPMRAALAEREPRQLQAWQDSGLYEQILAANAAGPRFVLHDGPPYANGSLHEGHFLNKILKDIVVKAQAMAGKRADFVPGWDCHGLPIELKVEKKLGAKRRELTPGQFRRACRQYAEEQVEVQRREFKRLGVFGRWDDPYLTMSFAYEAQTVRQLAEMARKGVLYRRKRPVHWCMKDVTALAEAEVEYDQKVSPSIYVRFPVRDGARAAGLLEAAPGLAGRAAELGLAIWTTTPWTIPANLAIAANPEIDYVAYDLPGYGPTVVARDLLGSFLQQCAPGELVQAGAAAAEPADDDESLRDAALRAARTPPLRDHTRVLAHFKGSALEGVVCRHPLLDRESPVLLAEHATTEAGTGLVHTAPGHGEDDFRLGVKHGLPVYTPVDGHGRFLAEAGLGLQGKKVFDANPEIVVLLKAAGALLNASGTGDEVRHSYPHCWRCKQPVIFRATDQWWIGLDVETDLGGRRTTIRKAALEAIAEIDARGGFVPEWGKNRILGMVENRPDWCVSRQRSWGVPIPVAYCAACREPLLSADAMDHVAGQFEKEGADAWFDRPLSELLPPGSACGKCGGTEFEKETDILDVWFDSGSSFAAVLTSGRWPGLSAPADLYLEGSDQHRGWFNSSLMIGVGTRGEAPYRALLTHGMVVDGQGRKMSKSLGNSPDPEAIIKKYGAEVVRLWVAASDYRDDIRLSTNILDTLSEGYRKIRNTLRYCLSQLYDFDPVRDAVPLDRLEPLDRWALSRFERYRALVAKGYETYEFHRVYHGTVELCATDLSAVYFDVLKDRTYCSGQAWTTRRAAQTVLHRIGRDLCRLLAPLASFTAEEAWQHLPAEGGKRPSSVFLAGLPAAAPELVDDALEAEMALLLEARSHVNGALEKKRVAKELGKSSEADLVLRLGGEAWGRVAPALDRGGPALADLFLVASVAVERAAGEVPFEVEVRKSANPTCTRCWRALRDVNADAAHPGLCGRCVRAITGAGASAPGAAQ